MSNSSLVSYTKISPNRGNTIDDKLVYERTHTIDTITIHCVVGQCSVETIGNVFAPTSRQASSNYGVGVDGRIGMYVEEKDRSWCSSNGANDNRAITIEVASDTTHPYAVNEKAYAALLDLVTDICKRNGIKKLVWSTDKNQRVNHLNGCNMTVHRDYANKSCPGDYLYNRHGEIAAEVNKRLGATTTTTTTSAVTGTASTGSETDQKKMWDFLYGKIGSAFGVAGLMGNLFAESALRSNNLQNAYEKKLGKSDTEYTAAVDNGSYTNFVKDSAGYGLAQWTYWSRKQALLTFAQGKKKSIGDFEMQLEFLWKELSESYKGVLSDLKAAKTVLSASNSVLTKFERPANQSESVQKTRASYGQKYYDKFAPKTTTGSDTNYLVRITISDLRIRSGPGTNYASKGFIKPGAYTIVQESTGTGATKWGKLKSGAGWISLDYAKKI